MTIKYKVWVEIEMSDDEENIHKDMQYTQSINSFDTYEEAEKFAKELEHISKLVGPNNKYMDPRT